MSWEHFGRAGSETVKCECLGRNWSGRGTWDCQVHRSSDWSKWANNDYRQIDAWKKVMKKEAKTDVGHWSSRSVKTKMHVEMTIETGMTAWMMECNRRERLILIEQMVWNRSVGGFEMIGEEIKKWQSSDEKCQWTRSEDWHGWGKQDRIVMVIIDREESEFKY